jgi:hypothetical protein
MRVALSRRRATVELQPESFAAQEEILRRYAGARRATRQSAVLGTAPLADSSKPGTAWRLIRHPKPMVNAPRSGPQFGGVSGAIRSPRINSSAREVTPRVPCRLFSGGRWGPETVN